MARRFDQFSRIFFVRYRRSSLIEQAMVSISSNGASAYMLFALCLTSYLSPCRGATSSLRPTVTIPQGKLEGFNMLTSEKRTIHGFTGVPYAQPPVGGLRFKAPLAPSPWNGTYDASSATPSCAQLTSWGAVLGDEDCLHLNLYTPKLPSTGNRSTLLPVIFYIVGGAFQMGNITRLGYGPDFLLNEDVILVIPDSRVGVLGFLSTGDEVAPGNFGMKDIVQALKWTRDNVEYFGGDPNRVTLAGGSSGAMSASWLALSDATEGLFQRYITQSGSALCPNLLEPRETYQTYATKLGEHFGCPTNSSELLVDCLRGINATQLIDTNSIFYEFQTYPTAVWYPTVEPDIEGALITKSPAALMAEGRIRDVPWLNSNVRDEGAISLILFQMVPGFFDAIMANLYVALPLIAAYSRSSTNVTAYTEGLISYYLNNLTADRYTLMTNLSYLVGDVTLMYPAYSALQQRLPRATQPSYSMSFEHRGVFSYAYLYSNGNTSYTDYVPHGEEIIYLFKNLNNVFGPPSYEYSKDDLTLVKEMVAMWVSFAKSGEPTPADANGEILWKPYTSEKDYLQVGNGSEIGMQMKYGLQKERMEFLDKLTADVPWKGLEE